LLLLGDLMILTNKLTTVAMRSLAGLAGDKKDALFFVLVVNGSMPTQMRNYIKILLVAFY
jgi:hypothetical protein